MTTTRPYFTALGRILSHELRIAILQQLADAVADDDRGRSPRTISDALGIPLGNVSYHMRTLLALDAIRLLRVEPRRGALEHFYTITGAGSDALEIAENR